MFKRLFQKRYSKLEIIDYKVDNLDYIKDQHANSIRQLNNDLNGVHDMFFISGLVQLILLATIALLAYQVFKLKKAVQ